MKIKDIISCLENFAPLSFQESYDNSGLIIGNPNSEVTSALISIDVTEEVIDEAIEKNINLIISHHPIIFNGLKKITGDNYIEKLVIKAIKNDIAIYAFHTNLDSVEDGVNSRICNKLGLKNCRILKALKGELKKIVTFVPVQHAKKVRMALFNAGAGYIGDYNQCSYNVEGKGTFNALDNTKPFVGKKGELHFEDEIRIETIFPKHLQNKIISSLKNAHPYEEVAYDIYPLDNKYDKAGIGMIGDLKNEIDEKDFLKNIKNIFKTNTIRYTKLLNKKIKKVAVCGGSGSFLLNDAICQKADIFISGDFKYHQFFDADNKILIADIGHFESEQFTVEIIYEILKKNLPKFAAQITKINTNPINYL